jgi:short-subunit dehydrogenase
MKRLADQRTILTGASGGIGAPLAAELSARGANLLLVGRRCEPLEQLRDRLRMEGGVAELVVADITTAAGRRQVVTASQSLIGGVDLLINNAGVMDYTLFADQDEASIDATIETNLRAPIQLTRAVLPAMLEQGSGRIVNIGSIFGSIAFACFSSYSATKFGLRGFSEALRRELEGSGVDVTYIAPRAVRTPLNSRRVEQMAEEVGMVMDQPQQIAARIVRSIEAGDRDRYLGGAERLFVRLNALFPRLVDRALRGQNRTMRRIAAVDYEV